MSHTLFFSCNDKDVSLLEALTILTMLVDSFLFAPIRFLFKSTPFDLMRFNRTFFACAVFIFTQMIWLSLLTLFSASALHKSRTISFWSTLSLGNAAHQHCASQEEATQVRHMPGLQGRSAVTFGTTLQTKTPKSTHTSASAVQ